MTKGSTSTRTGASGEKLAGRMLARKGYHILQYNFRCTGGEIDIVARDHDTYVFVEVKTRRAGSDELPEAALTARKKHRLAVAARTFMRTYSLHNVLFRFDLVGIEYSESHAPCLHHWENVIHYENAQRRKW